jgi:transcriptional regulator with XRE-family HTH domain
MTTDQSPFPGFDRVVEDTGSLIAELVHVRRSRGLSQTEVAARMRTSQSALARLESGRSDARLSTVTRYAAAVGATVGFALGGENGGRHEAE